MPFTLFPCHFHKVHKGSPALSGISSLSCGHWAGSVPGADSHYEDWLVTAAPTHLAGWQSCAPVAFFRQPPSLTAECCRLLNLRQFRYPWRAVRGLGFHWRKCKFKSLFMPQNNTDPSSVYILPARDGGMSGVRLARDKETENVYVCVCVSVTKRNSLNWRTDWLLGKAFCHIKPPPFPASKPLQCEGHPDRNVKIYVSSIHPLLFSSAES